MADIKFIIILIIELLCSATYHILFKDKEEWIKMIKNGVVE